MTFIKKNYKFKGIYKHYDDVPISGFGFNTESWINESFTLSNNIINSPDYNKTHKLLPMIVNSKFSKTNQIKIIDFGGNIGMDYQNLKLLCKNYIFKYFIIETNETCIYASKFKQLNDSIFISYNNFKTEFDNQIDICYCNSSLQYVNNYENILIKFASLNPKFIVFERLSIGNHQTFFTCQTNIGGCIPYCVINNNKFKNFLITLGYDIIYEEELPYKYNIDYNNLIDYKINLINIIFKKRSHQSHINQQLITMELINCPKCGSNISTKVCSGKDYLYHIPGIYHVDNCSTCGCWFQNPRPTYDDIIKTYPKFYAPHMISPNIINNTNNIKNIIYNIKSKIIYIFNKIIISNQYIKGITLSPNFIQNGKLLEIGCATGLRLEELRADGWSELYGIEMVQEAAMIAQNRGFKISYGKIEDILPLYQNAYFDVIIASMVLEHLQDPFTTVQQIATKIKPGGQFLFSTINKDSLDKKIFGCYWAGFDYPRHLTYFRISDILEMIQPSFDNIKIYYQNAPIDFIRSASWRNTKKDKIIIFIMSHIGELIGLLQIITKSASRVSIQCKRKIN